MNIPDGLLEPLARQIRFKKSLPFISTNILSVLDLGAGVDTPYLKFLKRNSVNVKEYIALEPRIKKGIRLKKKLPFKDSTFNLIVGFAFLEHVDYPADIMREAVRVLKPGGKIIFTAPSPRSKFLLEILSKVGLISGREISEHKRYFNKESLFMMLENIKDVKPSHKYFELGLNNLLIIEKS